MAKPGGYGTLWSFWWGDGGAKISATVSDRCGTGFPTSTVETWLVPAVSNVTLVVGVLPLCPLVDEYWRIWINFVGA